MLPPGCVNQQQLWDMGMGSDPFEPSNFLCSLGAVPIKDNFGMLQAPIVTLKEIEYGVYGDLIKIYPKPYSICLKGNINRKPKSH